MGNCWEDNHYGSAGQTDNFTVDPPACADGGFGVPPRRDDQGRRLPSCSQYDRNDPTWEPPGRLHVVRTTRPSHGPPTPAARSPDGAPRAACALGAAAALAVGVVRRRWSRAAGRRCGGLRQEGRPAGRAPCSVLAGGGVAVARTSPTLTTSGPTSVTGTAASAVFTIADRTVRQVRYADGGTLRYTFRLTNDDRLPVTVRGLVDSQPPSRLFHPTDVTPCTSAVARRPTSPSRCT